MTFPATPTELRALLEKHGIRVNKRLGQHFLADRNMLRWIAEQGELTPEDVVLEIGTGTGMLTNELAQRAGRVVTVEMSPSMYELSGELLSEHVNVVRLHADVLARRDELNPDVLSALAQAATDARTLKVVSNIPYNISSPVIIDLLESNLPLERIILTIQLEVAERLTASPGTKDYGFLTIIAGYHSEVSILRQIPKQVFWPQPKVISAVVKITPRKKKPPLRDYETFRAVARAIFDYRRKNILNSLAQGGMGEGDKAMLREALLKCGLDPESRGEGLNVEQICALADALAAT